MLAMHKDGLIALPPPKWRQNRPRPIVFGPDTEPPLFPPPTTLDEVRPLDLRTVVRGTRAGKLWNEFVARHHYLGYKTLVGARMRYAVHDRDGGPIATSASPPPPGSSPRATTSSDGRRNCARRTSRWWSTIRGSSSRPGEIPNLGSHLLAVSPPPPARGLGRALQHKGADRDVRRNSAIHRRRLRASGWVHVGTTRGRGRYDRQRQFDKHFERTSGSDRSEKTGNESSTGDNPIVTGRPNAYAPETDCAAAPSHGGAGPRAEPKAPTVGHFCPRGRTCSLHHKRRLCFRSRARPRGQNPARSSRPLVTYAG